MKCLHRRRTYKRRHLTCLQVRWEDMRLARSTNLITRPPGQTEVDCHSGTISGVCPRWSDQFDHAANEMTQVSSGGWRSQTTPSRAANGLSIQGQERTSPMTAGGPMLRRRLLNDKGPIRVMSRCPSILGISGATKAGIDQGMRIPPASVMRIFLPGRSWACACFQPSVLG